MHELSWWMLIVVCCFLLFCFFGHLKVFLKASPFIALKAKRSTLILVMSDTTKKIFRKITCFFSCFLSLFTCFKIRPTVACMSASLTHWLKQWPLYINSQYNPCDKTHVQLQSCSIWCDCNSVPWFAAVAAFNTFTTNIICMHFMVLYVFHLFKVWS